MATILRTKEGNWRAQVRRKGKYASRTFRLKSLGSEWVTETERMIDIGCEPTSRKIGTPKTIADLINLDIADMHEVGKPIRRSKNAVLEALERDIGTTRIPNLNC